MEHPVDFIRFSQDVMQVEMKRRYLQSVKAQGVNCKGTLHWLYILPKNPTFPICRKPGPFGFFPVGVNQTEQ
jgi:hypothetical protein